MKLKAFSNFAKTCCFTEFIQNKNTETGSFAWNLLEKLLEKIILKENYILYNFVFL
jgi:hypothetical protein